MDNQALQQIKDIIAKNEQVAILVGRNSRVDEMAAALSLYLSFQTAGKKVSIASATEPLVEHSSLVGIDKVSTQKLGNSSGDLVVSFPYKEEGEIEKVSYTIDNGYLNIIVKAAEQGLSFSEQDVRYSHGVETSGLMIMVGIPRLSDLGSLYNEESFKGATIINIDNKEQNENYGNVVLVSPRFSSVSEQVADLLLSLGYDFDADTAQNLLHGISTATSNFQSANTSYLAFEIAAILLRKGAKRVTSGSQPNQANQLNQQQPQSRPTINRQPRDNQRPQNPQQQQGQNQNRFERRPQQQNQPRSNQNMRDTQRPQQQNSQSNSQINSQPQVNNLQQTREQLSRIQPQPNVQEESQADDANTPADWLAPKVYKGSTNIS